jgi:hypothetical protein
MANFSTPTMSYQDVHQDATNTDGFLNGLGRMFYMVDPQESTYKSPEEVPFFFRQVSPPT